MSHPTIKVLLIQSDLGIVQRVWKALSHPKYAHFELDVVNELSSAHHYIEQGDIDVTLLDIEMLAAGEIDSGLLNCAHSPGIPIILLADEDDEELAFQAILNGADDYVVKDSLSYSKLARTVVCAFERRCKYLGLKEQTQNTPDEKLQTVTST